jgi:hypothetical protein
MKIDALYSHLNGQEHIIVHMPHMWQEIETVIASVDAEVCRTKVSQEKTKVGRVLFSPVEMNRLFKAELERRSWSEARTAYWVTRDHDLILRTMNMSPDDQRQEIIAAGQDAFYSYNQTDFVKERIAIEIQFGKYAFVAFDLFVKHMAFFVGNKIDVGVEVLPTKRLANEMSSGVPYYEGELYNLLRQGRSTPAVPLVLVGISY